MNSTRKLLIGALLSLVFAGLLVWIVYKKIQVGNSDAMRVSNQRHYVAVSRNVETGEKLTPDMLTSVTWFSSMPIDGAFESRDKAVGRLAAFPLSSGVVLSEKLLASPDSSLGLPQKIPSGMRAIAIQTDEVADFAGFLFPGAHVDVLATIKTGAMAIGATPVVGGDNDRTIQVLEDVTVLATGKQMVPDPTGKPTTVSVVTLLVSPDDARKMALAQLKGAVHLVLRNGADRGNSARRDTSVSDLIGVPSPRAVGIGHSLPKKRASAQSDGPQLQRLEIVVGGKTFTQTYRNNLPVGEGSTPNAVGGTTK